MIKIKIKDKEYKVKLAITDDEKEKGLQGVTWLPSDEGMLFVYDEVESSVSYWGEDTPLNLDLIFIGDDDKVISVQKLEANTQDAHEESNVLYVLELNIDSGVEAGDLVETIEEDNDDESEDDPLKDEGEISDEDVEEVAEENQKMMILNAKGKSQMDLEGGERIFSRKNTLSLLKFAKRAYDTKSTASYKTLGKKVFLFMDTQDGRDNEYVELPETKKAPSI